MAERTRGRAAAGTGSSTGARAGKADAETVRAKKAGATPRSEETSSATTSPPKKGVPKTTAEKVPAEKAPAKKPAAKRSRATSSTPATTATRRRATRTAGAAPAASSLPVREEESPWTPEELEAVRADVAAEIDRLRGEIEAAETQIAELIHNSGDGAGDDQVDSGSKAFEREHEMTIANNAREALAQNEHALQRIGAGTYGTCESCGNPVGKRRLQAFPRATLCLSCKQQQERR